MAIAPGYVYDLFISYAHADDVTSEGEDGWVSYFAKRLELALRQRMGGAEALKFFFDSRANRANSQLSDLLAAATQSALFLAVGSPSYAARDWPRQELHTFIARVPDPSRLFMIECLPLNEGEYYPPPLDSHICVPFWKASGPRSIPMSYSPVGDAEEFQLLIHGLAADMRNRLLPLRLLATHQTEFGTRLEVKEPPSRPAGQRKLVLLAQVTDDIEDESDQLRRYLSQYEGEISVLPRAAYPQGGLDFKRALEQDLTHAHLFVQLLGRRAGRVPPDLPEGYTRGQFEAAKAAGVPIVQWRHPALDIETVDPAYRVLLTAETVVACGFEAFKQHVLSLVRKPETKAASVRPSTVFINADDKDINVAKEIGRECLRHALTTVLPVAVGSPSEVSRKDLEDNLTDCDVLLFIYGDTSLEWIRSQLRFFNKVRPRRETDPRLLAICCGPPSGKPEIGITFPSAHVINCPDGWSMDEIRALISGLGQ